MKRPLVRGSKAPQQTPLVRRTGTAAGAPESSLEAPVDYPEQVYRAEAAVIRCTLAYVADLRVRRSALYQAMKNGPQEEQELIRAAEALEDLNDEIPF